ncbi:hypothetical protein GE061_018146 [Apolygus lucorum]|uniref:Histone-lysine N-methyltransferase n=1 Tax=Apolygus lucorum TaxID=248454 RepID=A0A8S9XCX3_APOLU|nr:hypothetical protein GE061_018146 [Apolygus lucorum]
MANTPQYSTSSSPLHPPPSPMLSQFQNPSSSPMPQQSPRVQSYQTANSPMTPQSPMVYSGLQTPTSPMPQFNQPNSPMPPHSPRVQQQYGQPPSSPMGSNSQNSMMQQQYVHRPNSPMVPMGSPMPMRRPSSTGGSIASSPAAERPQSVEPRTPQEQDVNNMLGGGGGGGGGGYLPFNPIPFPPELYRDGYLKIGLKGGSPMWSDKTLPRKPLLKGKVGQPSPGTSANSEEKSRKSLVSVDYNDFDEESTPPTTPPVKAALIKKSDGPVKTRQSEDTDSELTVYDDIVLVEGCKEGNLEVEELQSALENNVMSTVVSMPMMIDDPDILDDCLVSSSDLVVLDVDNTNNDTDCILGKDDENMLLLDEDISDGLKVDDELMELDEDLPSSPPVGRKRMSGKVLPGQSIHQEDQKRIPETPDSPEDSPMDTTKDRNEVTSSGEEKVKAEDRMKSESTKSQDVLMDRNVPTSVQPNVVVSRNSAAFTPISTQKSIPVCSERHLSKQQAAIASLVQDAVNAAKLAAAEAQNSQKTPSTEASNASGSHVFSRPLNIVHGGRGPQNQYLPSAVITNKIENQLAGGSELNKKDGKTIKLEPSSPDHSPTKSEPRAYENSIPLEHRNRIMEFLKSDEPTGASERDHMKNFGLPNKRPNLILKLEENNEGESGSKMSLRLDNSLRGMDRNAIQKNSSMIFNLVSEKSDGTEKPELKFADRSKQQNMNESQYNSNRGEQVTLPAVSSSILEAQLTSMLRSSASDPPTSSNQKIIYAFVNHNNKEPTQQRENPSPHEEIKVEGLAAHLQRTIKSETEVRMNENDIIRNAKIHQNYKPGLYVPSKIKPDSFIVSGTHYKLYTGSQGDNLVVPSEENKTQNHYLNKNLDNNSNNHPQVIVKQEPGLSSINKPKPTDRFTSSDLQQRVVSSSELPQMLNEKETHHVSFSGVKAMQKDEPKKFMSLSNMLMPRRDSDEGKGNLRFSRTPDDSQNVLLKQLLQSTACATSTPSPQTPSLPIVPSLEAQLARPVPPTPSSLIPPLLNEPSKPPAAVKVPPSSEVPSSPQTPKPPSVPLTPTTPESTRAPSTASCLDELLSPPPLPPTVSSLQGGPVIKREPMTTSMPPQGSTSPMTSPMEIKKEVVPVNVPVAVEVKKEVVSSDEMLSPGLRMEQETPGDPSQDIKKQKRRLYQQKRRQSLGKESVGGTPKKRPRKSSKVEEDYDSFIDSLMLQLRQIPTTMTICEPNLTYNFTGSPVFGSGDLSKVNSCTRLGELRGTYGNAYLPHENDYYNTIPFGDLPPKAPSAPSTQRGFYNEEFAPLKLHATKDEFDDRKYDYNRDTNDTPDTIVSSSSPECIMPEFPTRYPGLQFIDSDSEDEKLKPSRFSPDIPIISPLVVRPKPIRFYSDMDKENEGPQGKKHCDNVTVTLTLNSQAADDVLSVLRNLANVLRIPVPVHYSITERMSKPSHRLGMCKIRSKDGKEGGQVDIQSILNGSTKFCRHCEVVITNNLMRKRASDLPLVAKQGEEELYFCSSACYMQLALAHPAPVHQEKKPTSTEVPPFMGTRGAGKRESRTSIDKAIAPPVKKAPSRYRVWTSMTIPPPSSRHKKPTEKEITEMMFKCGIPLAPPKLPEDTRTCLFCHQMGDGVTHGPARLLNYDVNKWVHLNCALWSDEVYETTSGGLVNVEQALQNGSSASCAYCNTTGATLKCYKNRCSVVYHLPCAVKDACVFYKNKTLYCASHVPKNEKENELTTLSVMRRVYIQRDEPRQIASIMHNTEQNNLLRVGSLTFLSVGQLLPHQLQNFHTPNYIYPIGYKILRMYWSMRVANRRCKYICSIHESEGRPEFRIVVQERGEQDLELKDSSARGVWLKVLEPLAEIRRNDTLVKMFSKYITGEDLFGLTEPVVVRVLESLPGIDTLSDYKFKYGKNPFLELPLAINPTGCARSEVRPKGPGVMRKAHTQRTSSVSYRPSQSPSISIPGEPLCPYSKQFVHSKSSQYKKMKQEWRNNVYLARSKIQGLGLYAARDLEKHTMVIEYIGEIIRTEVAETREKQYEAKNRGIYMFRLDEDRVVDATLSGGLARYINHSCYPNCVAETVEVERDLRIIIFTKRRISRGEELAYDYKFDIEDDQHKIPCMCGAPNCRKWMN